nr:DUF2147 domain-containing protein [Novosphingobium taihuense]
MSQAVTSAPESFLLGTWANPEHSLEVRIARCGATLCGMVATASAEEIADARDSGSPGLVGMMLLRHYRADGPGHWSGNVFVPDIGRELSSHIVALDKDHVRVSGCLMGRFLCKSQVWQRA